MRSIAAKLFATLAIATSLATVAVGQASADPNILPTLPAAQDIVGVGSKNTQLVLDQLSADYNSFLGAGSTLPHLYSWDATDPTGGGSTTIANTKTGSASNIPRLNGSSAGTNALAFSFTNTTVDFARSSKYTGGEPTGLSLVWFAKDGLAWAGSKTGNAPANLTTADLKGIYAGTILNWNQITDIPGYVGPNATIKAYLPPTTSDTRSFFLTAINGGVTPLIPGATIITGPEEDEGTNAVFSDPNVIFPYSAAHYIGQLNGHKTTTDDIGNLSIRSVNGTSPLTGTTSTLNPAFTASAYGRRVYNVFRTSEYNGTTTQSTALLAIFGSTGWICSNATATADLKSYGFQVLPPAACGTITTT